MTDNSKICVAICNYNHQKYLKESISSIVNQTYKNLDIVIVDDGSDDKQLSKEIANGFNDSRIRYIQIDKNTGKWNALNTAFESTNAMFCTSHDADDISLPWRLEAQLLAMIETKTNHNLCGFLHCWDDDEIFAGYQLKKPSTLGVMSADEVCKTVLIGYKTPGVNHFYTGKFETAGASALFSKWIWDIGFRFNPPNMGLRVIHSEDSDFNCRLTLGRQNTSILMETPYLYRRNISTNKEEK